ncbi:hypothetical protein Peur_004129 [Populus x canadensis]
MLLQMLLIHLPEPAFYIIPLENGQLLTIPPYLVKVQRHHLHHLEQYGADLILGCGFVWVGEHVKAMDSTTIEDQLNNTEQQQLTKYNTTSKDMLQELRQSIMSDSKCYPCFVIFRV